MTTLLAWRNLVSDPIRFAVTVIGIIFAVTLISIQGGMLMGFARTSSALVDRSTADLWLMSRGTKNVDQSVAINEKYAYKALSVPGVEAISRVVIRFVIWRKRDGSTEMVIVVGLDPDNSLVKPWNLSEGDIRRLHEPGAVIVDRLYQNKLGVEKIGSEIEISNRYAKVVGLTDGIRTFTQSPYVFTSYNSALKFTDVADGGGNYVLIKAAKDVSLSQLQQQVAAAVPELDVLTAAQFSTKTRNYWIFTTGAGLALALAAVLGTIVGLVIVSQTLYAATIERLPEYATLSAIGAKQSYLSTIVLKQGLIAGVIGAVIALTLSIVIIEMLKRGPAAIILTHEMIVGIGIGAVALSALASQVAIRKLSKVDPTSVFR